MLMNSGTNDVTQSLPAGLVLLPLIMEEATRQLGICNSCRYCEGLCAVFPALERRTLFEIGDVSQLANLCHDCRACFDSCMYTAPHEFDVNIPKLLSSFRVLDYKRYVWPRQVPRLFSGWIGVFSGALMSMLLIFLIAISHVGLSGLITKDSGPLSPYLLISSGVLIILLSVPSLFSVVVMVVAGRKYWREVGGTPNGLTLKIIGQSIWYAATLRYLGGGGAGCYYPDDEKPEESRRTLHMLVAYGFGFCFVSTTAAAISQDILGIEPPYPWISVPVISGVIGGIGLVIGCLGLLLLKVRSSHVTSVAEMTIKDYGLLIALEFLALSGLATLLTRSTSAFGIVFLIHLSAIVLAFAAAPYSKFVHVVFRFLALLRDNFERAQLLKPSSK
ncbi:MAG TPA: tricarballylate utilization 4Fe-4S protein TcuB [Candidatus Nanopelagicaceae bacterium]